MLKKRQDNKNIKYLSELLLSIRMAIPMNKKKLHPQLSSMAKGAISSIRSGKLFDVKEFKKELAKKQEEWSTKQTQNQYTASNQTRKDRQTDFSDEQLIGEKVVSEGDKINNKEKDNER